MSSLHAHQTYHVQTIQLQQVGPLLWPGTRQDALLQRRLRCVQQPHKVYNPPPLRELLSAKVSARHWPVIKVCRARGTCSAVSGRQGWGRVGLDLKQVVTGRHRDSLPLAQSSLYSSYASPPHTQKTQGQPEIVVLSAIPMT